MDDVIDLCSSQQPLASFNQDQTVAPCQQEEMLVFRMEEHQSVLQKLLYKQYINGQNCDLTLCAGQVEFNIHTCVIAGFSSTINDHLLQASVTRALASLTGAATYDAEDEHFKFSVIKSGEKRVRVLLIELGRVSVSYSGTIGICLKMTPTIGIGICFKLSRVQQIVLE